MGLIDFLRDLWHIRDSGLGTDELSYYPAFSTLLNELGTRLEPTVRCVMNLRGAGAGLPDGGLYAGVRSGGAGVESAIPDRGAIEVKPPADQLDDDEIRRQVERYVTRYRLVLATNLRTWRLVELAGSTFVAVDEFTIADNEAAFWRLARRPEQIAPGIVVAFEDFLARSLLRGAPLDRAADVALLMASYAREARRRLGSHNPAPLRTLKSTLETALGTKFDRRDGDAFFRSTLIQTLFYGLFSAWVLWSREPERQVSDKFNWHDSLWQLRVPMVRSLFEQVATPAVLSPLHLTAIMDAVQDALNRVPRVRFFAAFDSGQVVQHFYEPFLRAFDPWLRRKMGVWFTPPELVEYMVRRVDNVLRTELGVTGLDDPRVHVLDPCVGTGSFLVAALRLIAERVGSGPATGMTVKSAVLQRFYGFDLLPAPYVVAHLQIGMFLQTLEAPLDEAAGERALVYITNSLTGWREQDLAAQPLPIPEFEQERDAANNVKREAPIWVVFGNPPYDGFSGVSPSEEQGLIEPYKRGLRRYGINKHKLDDPYIRFFRIAENRIAQHEPYRGIVCYVSNSSFVNHKSAVLVRKSLLENFDRVWIDDLHGNRTITEYGPDGRTSETIFSLEGYSPGIKQGVATSLWLRREPKKVGVGEVYFRDDFDASRAADRRRQMLEALSSPTFDAGYVRVEHDEERYLSFKPATSLPQYRCWPSVEQLAAAEPSLGPNENRRGALMDSTRDALEARMQAYFGTATVAEIKRLGGAGIVQRAARFDPQRTRARLRGDEAYEPAKLRRFLFRPFDLRWAYLTGAKLWNEGRTEFFSRTPEGTRFVVYRRNGVDENDGLSLMLTSALADQHALHKDAYVIPYTMRNHVDGARAPRLRLEAGDQTANLSSGAYGYLTLLGYVPTEPAEHAVLWEHVQAIAAASSYQRENAGLLVARPPRIPLPRERNALDASAALGRRVAQLLDMSVPVLWVTHGALNDEVAMVGVLGRTDSTDVRPFRPQDLGLRVGWGRLSGNGVVPGKGRVVRHAEADTNNADDIEDTEDVGEDVTFDILLNEIARWRNIPGLVWTYRVAGYRVLKKWLSYREHSIIGRALTIQEANEFSSIARRIAALLKLEPELNVNYEAIKSASYDFVAVGE